MEWCATRIRKSFWSPFTNDISIFSLKFGYLIISASFHILLFVFSLCLKCTLLGHPKPTVTWEKNGDLVDEDRTEGHIQTRIDGNNYFLEIAKCGCEDAGKYTVTAKNSLGKQTASVEVTVTGRSCVI